MEISMKTEQETCMKMLTIMYHRASSPEREEVHLSWKWGIFCFSALLFTGLRKHIL